MVTHCNRNIVIYILTILYPLGEIAAKCTLQMYNSCPLIKMRLNSYKSNKKPESIFGHRSQFVFLFSCQQMTFSPDGMLNCVHRSKRPQANQTGFHLSLPALLFRSQNLRQDPHFQSSKQHFHFMPPSKFIRSCHSYLVIVFFSK